MKQHRYRPLGTEQRGWKLALVEDRETGETIRAYYRLGRWRFYRDDTTIKDAALTANARRLLGKQRKGD